MIATYNIITLLVVRFKSLLFKSNCYWTTPEIVLIRGLPGSRSTTAVIEKHLGHTLCEANKAFYHAAYPRYSRSRVKDAHTLCLSNVSRELQKGNSVIVANMFIHLWELTPYIELGYPLKVIVAECDYGHIHNTSDDIVANAYKDFKSTMMNILFLCLVTSNRNVID